MGGASLPEPFVATLLAFQPKSVSPSEVGEVWREAIVLRPLGLQNTDAKIVQHALNAVLMPSGSLCKVGTS